MLTLLRIANVVLLLALVGCLAGALAGLIVFVPIVAGAWFLNAMALIGYEEAARPGWSERASPDATHVAPARVEAREVPSHSEREDAAAA